MPDVHTQRPNDTKKVIAAASTTRLEGLRVGTVFDTIVLSVITATFTGPRRPRRKSLFPKAARLAAPCATYCYSPFLESCFSMLPLGRATYRIPFSTKL